MKITVFGAEWCPWCTKVEEFLKEHDIEFELKDIDKTPGAGDELTQVSGQDGIPVTVIEDNGKKEVIIGFDVEKIKKALKIE